MTSEQLGIRLMAHRGKALLPEYLDKLSRELDTATTEIELIDVVQTHEIQKRLNDLIRSDLRNAYISEQHWDVDDKDKIVSTLNRLRQEMPDRKMIMFKALSEYCGAVKVGLHDILDHAFNLISEDEDITAYSEDGSMYLLFDWSEVWNPESGATTIEFTLILEGNDWSSVIRHC